MYSSTVTGEELGGCWMLSGVSRVEEPLESCDPACTVSIRNKEMVSFKDK